jgi:hypothetical protein
LPRCTSRRAASRAAASRRESGAGSPKAISACRNSVAKLEVEAMISSATSERRPRKRRHGQDDRLDPRVFQQGVAAGIGLLDAELPGGGLRRVLAQIGHRDGLDLRRLRSGFQMGIPNHAAADDAHLKPFHFL